MSVGTVGAHLSQGFSPMALCALAECFDIIIFFLIKVPTLGSNGVKR